MKLSRANVILIAFFAASFSKCGSKQSNSLPKQSILGINKNKAIQVIVPNLPIYFETQDGRPLQGMHFSSSAVKVSYSHKGCLEGDYLFPIPVPSCTWTNRYDLEPEGTSDKDGILSISHTTINAEYQNSKKNLEVTLILGNPSIDLDCSYFNAEGKFVSNIQTIVGGSYDEFEVSKINAANDKETCSFEMSYSENEKKSGLYVVTSDLSENFKCRTKYSQDEIETRIQAAKAKHGSHCKFLGNSL